MTSYYQQPPRPERGTFTYTTTYPQDNISYAYTAAPATPTSPSYSPSGYYPPTSSSSTKQHRTSYYPPSSSAAYAPIPPAAPRRRSSSFSSSAAAQAQAPAEVLYRHINGGPPASSSKPSTRSSSKPRRFSKTAAADDYEYLYGPGADDKFYVSDDNEDEYVYDYDKDKLSQRFDRGRSGLRRSTTTTTERIGRSKTRRLSTAADDYEDGLLTNLGLGIGGLKIASSSSKPRERSATRTRGRDGRDARERSLPRAPRAPAPQRASPPPAPVSSLSTESNRSRRSGHHHGVSFADDPMVIPIHSREKVREERKEKSWMNINGNKISVDHKGVKINGQRYDAPGGKGVFNVGGIKVRVDGGVISLV